VSRFLGTPVAKGVGVMKNKTLILTLAAVIGLGWIWARTENAQPIAEPLPIPVDLSVLAH
jgi:hypothetical protein